MLRKAIKKMVLVGLSLMLILPTIVSAKQTVTLENKVDYFHDEYSKYQDFDKALRSLTKKYKSVTVNSNSSKKIAIDNKGNIIDESSSDVNINYVYPSVLNWNESIIWDNDSQKFVYLGSWSWDYIAGDEPWDHIGVVTNNENTMPLDGGSIVFRGYDGNGNQTAYLSTGSGMRTGYVQQSTQTNNIAMGFWINEKYVESGSISAHLGNASYNSNDRVQMQYDHSYTDYSLTGIGVSVGYKEGSFNVTWDSKVVTQGPYWSIGTYVH